VSVVHVVSELHLLLWNLCIWLFEHKLLQTMGLNSRKLLYYSTSVGYICPFMIIISATRC
jgi:hypothetical protein